MVENFMAGYDYRLLNNFSSTKGLSEFSASLVSCDECEVCTENDDIPGLFNVVKDLQNKNGDNLEVHLYKLRTNSPYIEFSPSHYCVVHKCCGVENSWKFMVPIKCEQNIDLVW